MISLGHIERLDRPLVRISKAAAWASLASACAAWAFDAMDLQIFTLVLLPSVSELVHSTDPGVVARAGGLIVGCKLVAWAWEASHSASPLIASDARRR